jgi:hypothetical protein
MAWTFQIARDSASPKRKHKDKMRAFAHFGCSRVARDFAPKAKGAEQDDDMLIESKIPGVRGA